MVDGNAGKGDRYRPVDKEKYDRTYIRVFGERCSVCKGKKKITVFEIGNKKNKAEIGCSACKGKGKIYDYNLLKELEGGEKSG
jgi:RecJ-like exonuclease